jgi:hypothetical protein
MPTTIHAENWNSSVVPGFPNGWNVGASAGVTVSGSGPTPISGPILVHANGGGGTLRALTWGTADGVSGNVTVTGTVNFFSSNVDTYSVFCRSSASTTVYTSSSMYDVEFNTSDLFLVKRVSGSPTTLATNTTGAISTNIWYQVSLTANGSSSTVLAVTVQRLSDGFWLGSSGWTSTPSDAITFTDSATPITGSGFAGLASADHGDDVYFDDWSLATVSLAEFAAPGSFALSGINAKLEYGHVVSAAPGSFALTGIAANLTENIATLVTAAGVFTLTGTSATLLHGRRDNAQPGVFVITGENATLFFGVSEIASPGSFAITGINAQLEWGHVLAAGLGSFSLTGISASLMPSGLTVATPGKYTIGRISANLLHDSEEFAQPGIFVLTGQSAALEQPATLDATPATFVISGVPAVLGHGGVEFASRGSFVITGMPAVLTFVGSIGTVEYHVYSNTGVGDPIDYLSPIDTTATLTYTTSPLSFPGTWSFGVRAFWSGSGLEELNVDAAVTIILDASGRDITNTPPSPLGLRAFATAGGTIRAEWTEPPTSVAKTPTGFHVYWGSPTINYGTIGAAVLFNTGIAGSFVANIGPLTNGTTYQIGVRAYNSVSEETNTTTVSVTADGTGPSAVIDLTATATT